VTPETELLLNCAHVRPDAAVLRASAERPIDWPRFLELAEWHSLAPLAYWKLREACPEAVPPEPFKALGERFRSNAERNLILTSQLLEILGALERGGVFAAAFKGPVLAWWLHPHPALRVFTDLDVWVRPEQVAKAREVLCAERYRPRIALDGAVERTFLRWLGQMPFTREDRFASIDLHWSLGPLARATPLQGTGFTQVRIGSREVTTFCAEDTLLLLAYHGAKHCWTRLCLLCDLAVLLAAVTIDWERTLAEAARLRMMGRVLLALSLAQELLGVELPASVQGRLRGDRRVGELIAEARDRLLSPEPACEESRFQLRAMDCLRDRLRFRLSAIFEPTEADWTALRIPPSLFPLYYLARPARLLVKHGWGQARRVLRLS